MTLKTGVMMLKIKLCHQMNNLHLLINSGLIIQNKCTYVLCVFIRYTYNTYFEYMYMYIIYKKILNAYMFVFIYTLKHRLYTRMKTMRLIV